MILWFIFCIGDWGISRC